MSWTVYTSWPGYQTRETYTGWPTARRRALLNTCCAGVRYVSVQGPGDVVVGEWDRYTNLWREYQPPSAERAAQQEESTR